MVSRIGRRGFIGCWNDKYHWTFWRPITAIREADTDGNPATEADPDWTPLFDPATAVIAPPPLATPPFPDHPSAHSCASSAIVHTLQSFFGTDKIPFSIFSSESATPRTFDRFSGALKEVIDARVWGGIHFRTADVQGGGARQESRPLAREALLPPDSRTLTRAGATGLDELERLPMSRRGRGGRHRIPPPKARLGARATV